MINPIKNGFKKDKFNTYYRDLINSYNMKNKLTSILIFLI